MLTDAGAAALAGVRPAAKLLNAKKHESRIRLVLHVIATVSPRHRCFS